MKKQFISLLLIFICFFCFADKIFMVQGGVFMSKKSFKEDSGSKISHSFTSAGLNFVTFVGGDIGFFTAGGFLFPLSAAENIDGSKMKVSLDGYDSVKYATEILIGIGYNLSLTANAGMLIGGGAHFNGIILASSGYNADEYWSFVIGPGVNTTLYYNLNPTMNLNISATVAYDILEFLHLPGLPENVEYTGGLDIGIYAGIGFSY